MDVRRASSTDAESISRLVRGLSDSFFQSPGGAGAEPYFASTTSNAIASNIAAANFDCVVAEEGGVLVGYVALRDGRHLYHLFVASGHQGRGLARTLWNIVRHRAQEAGNPGEFTVNASMNAVPVYERFGFKATSEVVRSHGIVYLPMRMPREAAP